VAGETEGGGGGLGFLMFLVSPVKLRFKEGRVTFFPVSRRNYIRKVALAQLLYCACYD
jgi:hypothetical protein